MERYAAISVAILGDPISNCGPLVVTAEHNRSLEEVGGRPSRPEWLVDQFNSRMALRYTPIDPESSPSKGGKLYAPI